MSLGDSIVDFIIRIYLSKRDLDFVEHFPIMSQNYLIIYPCNYIPQIFKNNNTIEWLLRGDNGVSQIFHSSSLPRREEGNGKINIVNKRNKK